MADYLDVFGPLAVVLAAAAAALVVTALLRMAANRLFRRVPEIRRISARARNPFRVLLAALGMRVGFGLTAADEPWFAVVDWILVVVLIGALAWFAIVMLLVIETAILTKYRTDTKDNRRLRRLKTQVILGRRVAVSLLVVIAAACVLLTIPQVRALGAGILASAGVLSVVAGLAAQSSLTNVFAGMQLAFTDAIRVDDVVVVEKQWGTVEEITMTYVVVHIWDDRRLILPSTYFTTTPFENWTRQTAALLGTVELDVDWRVPVDELRAQLKTVVEDTGLWDGRTAVLQVTDAVNSLIRLRILVSAEDSGTLFDLRCLVREAMVSFVQREHPQALPRQRWEAAGGNGHDGAARHAAPAAPSADEAQLFTGSLDAVERNRSFTGPGEEVYEERGRRADQGK
ncbi:mechanosensitive ion channel family protein [Arthrobacter sp. I2-34]|uniref:Mechanosensitive ion channel family protein n=1 Tax=Arthrobacter hankyongi TaxID=2904801 RepID=A0ABS9L9W3_9MICC|nr:mechanosensitive ion channel domain-containing protein [Arthrobacter hankyongi]MCG2623298.1 mechanosensitive ion channel family protein [Arthrobacter hankyongi]